MVRAQKAELRKKLIKRRKLLSAPRAAEGSRKVIERVRQSGLLNGCRVAALYASADREVVTRPLFEELREKGVRVVLPRVRGKGPHLDFYEPGEWDRMEVSIFGIPEPVPSGDPVAYEEFDFVLVPGIAFDRRGGRLGYGMGCYDRVLEKTRPGVPLVGVCYDFQLVDEVPMEDHDVLLSVVASESEIALPGFDEGRRLKIK